MGMYQLLGEYNELMDMLMSGEYDQLVIRDTIEGLDGEIEEKANNIGKMIKMLSGKQKMVKKEADRLDEMQKSIGNSIDTLKRSLEYCMQVTGKPKFRTELFNFWMQKNQPSLKIDDISLDKVPEQFIKRDPEINRAKVREYIEAGNSLDWARFEQTESIRMR